MKYLVSILTLLIAIQSSCKQKQSEKVPKWDQHKKLEFLVYGLPGLSEIENARYVIANRWGFRDKIIAGCVITKALIDSVKEQNNQVNKALAEKFGKDWQAKFDKEVKEEFANEKKVIAILNHQKANIQKRKELEKEGNRLNYHLDLTDKNSFYTANAIGWGRANGKDGYVTYYQYSIDLNNSKVKLLSDVVTKL